MTILWNFISSPKTWVLTLDSLLLILPSPYQEARASQYWFLPQAPRSSPLVSPSLCPDAVMGWPRQPAFLVIPLWDMVCGCSVLCLVAMDRQCISLWPVLAVRQLGNWRAVWFEPWRKLCIELAEIKETKAHQVTVNVNLVIKIITKIINTALLSFLHAIPFHLRYWNSVRLGKLFSGWECCVGIGPEFSSQHPHKRLGMTTRYVCNPSTWVAWRQEDNWASWLQAQGERDLVSMRESDKIGHLMSSGRQDHTRRCLATQKCTHTTQKIHKPKRKNPHNKT